MSCLPDFLATPDAHGIVTLVVGTGAKVKAAALANGFNFLEDTRRPNQRVLGVLYRIVLPNSDFEETSLYKGEYRPVFVKCSRAEFLDAKCD